MPVVRCHPKTRRKAQSSRCTCRKSNPTPRRMRFAPSTARKAFPFFSHMHRIAPARIAPQRFQRFVQDLLFLCQSHLCGVGDGKKTRQRITLESKGYGRLGAAAYNVVFSPRSVPAETNKSYGVCVTRDLVRNAGPAADIETFPHNGSILARCLLSTRPR